MEGKTLGEKNKGKKRVRKSNIHALKALRDKKKKKQWQEKKSGRRKPWRDKGLNFSKLIRHKVTDV